VTDRQENYRALACAPEPPNRYGNGRAGTTPDDPSDRAIGRVSDLTQSQYWGGQTADSRSVRGESPCGGGAVDLSRRRAGVRAVGAPA